MASSNLLPAKAKGNLVDDNKATLTIHKHLEVFLLRRYAQRVFKFLPILRVTNPSDTTLNFDVADLVQEVVLQA